jgi:hypothetical protein
LANNSADQFFPRTARTGVRSSGDSARRRSSRARMPSSAGYMIAAVAAAIALFFALWWMLVVGGDEAPWVPAGLAASVVLLVAVSAREVVMRRAWTRYLLENSASESGARTSGDKPNSSKKTQSTSVYAATLATIQKQSADAEATSSPDSHLDVFHLCQSYLESTEEALSANNLSPEKRNSIRVAQDRVRGLEKHHLLTWARGSSRMLTHEAQKRVRVSDKIETAYRAVECLDSALRVFPEEHELNDSKVAITEYIASVKVAHWVELAERAAFKGHYRRAIDRYKDALFYLERESVKEDVRTAGTDRISQEIELLRLRLKSTSKAPDVRG